MWLGITVFFLAIVACIFDLVSDVRVSLADLMSAHYCSLGH